MNNRLSYSITHTTNGRLDYIYTNTHTEAALYDYVGGNANGVFIVSNLPLEMYNNKAELFFNSSNSFRYDGHWRTTPMIHTMEGGQHVKVVVSNHLIFIILENSRIHGNLN